MDEGHTVDLVYADFAKAFDFVNHRFLLAKLKSSGTDGPVMNWIKPYVSNRSCQFQIDGVLSEQVSPKIQALANHVIYKRSARRSQWSCIPFLTLINKLKQLFEFEIKLGGDEYD